MEYFERNGFRSFDDARFERRKCPSDSVKVDAVLTAHFKVELLPITFMNGIYKRELFCLGDEERARLIADHERSISLKFPCALVAPCQPKQETPIPNTRLASYAIRRILGHLQQIAAVNNAFSRRMRIESKTGRIILSRSIQPQ